MAAQEYYQAVQGVHELPGHNKPNLYPQQSQPPPPPPQYQQQPSSQKFPRPHYNAHTYSNTPPPSYSAYPQKPPQQPQYHQPYPPQQQYPVEKPRPMTAPYPNTPPASSFSRPPPQQPPQPGYLGAPLQPIRSHSQPARVRFADQDSDRSTELGETDSDSSPHRQYHQQHHKHSSHNRPHRHRPQLPTRDSDRDSDYSDRERSHRHHKHSSRDSKLQDKEHKNRDTFLGAGAGTLIGDAIFPGLGTAAGLLLGGYSGRKYAERSVSEGGEQRSRERRGDREVRRKDSYDSSDGEYRRRSSRR